MPSLSCRRNDWSLELFTWVQPLSDLYKSTPFLFVKWSFCHYTFETKNSGSEFLMSGNGCQDWLRCEKPTSFWTDYQLLLLLLKRCCFMDLDYLQLNPSHFVRDLLIKLSLVRFLVDCGGCFSSCLSSCNLFGYILGTYKYAMSFSDSRHV